MTSHCRWLVNGYVPMAMVSAAYWDVDPVRWVDGAIHVTGQTDELLNYPDEWDQFVLTQGPLGEPCLNTSAAALSADACAPDQGQHPNLLFSPCNTPKPLPVEWAACWTPALVETFTATCRSSIDCAMYPWHVDAFLELPEGQLCLAFEKEEPVVSGNWTLRNGTCDNYTNTTDWPPPAAPAAPAPPARIPCPPNTTACLHVVPTDHYQLQYTHVIELATLPDTCVQTGRSGEKELWMQHTRAPSLDYNVWHLRWVAATPATPVFVIGTICPRPIGPPAPNRTDWAPSLLVRFVGPPVYIADLRKDELGVQLELLGEPVDGYTYKWWLDTASLVGHACPYAAPAEAEWLDASAAGQLLLASSRCSQGQGGCPSAKLHQDVWPVCQPRGVPFDFVVNIQRCPDAAVSGNACHEYRQHVPVQHRTHTDAPQTSPPPAPSTVIDWVWLPILLLVLSALCLTCWLLCPRRPRGYKYDRITGRIESLTAMGANR